MAQPRESILDARPEVRAQVENALQQSAAGEVVYLGSFSRYAD